MVAWGCQCFLANKKYSQSTNFIAVNHHVEVAWWLHSGCWWWLTFSCKQIWMKWGSLTMQWLTSSMDGCSAALALIAHFLGKGNSGMQLNITYSILESTFLFPVHQSKTNRQWFLHWQEYPFLCMDFQQDTFISCAPINNNNTTTTMILTTACCKWQEYHQRWLPQST